MSMDWQWLVVGACIVASALHLALHAWPQLPVRVRRAAVLHLLRAPRTSLRYRLGRRLAPPARIALKSASSSDCGGCSGCATEGRTR
jgi:hypothetical protein